MCAELRQTMVVILIGVTGSGKTTVGRLLATELGWTFYDADSFHSPANVQKMRTGTPLTDEDRRPWLDELRTVIQRTLAGGKHAVLACSALKALYREHLRVSHDVKFVYLEGDGALIAERLRHRREHFMSPGLLSTQFEALQPPAATDAVIVNAERSPIELVATIRRELGI